MTETICARAAALENSLWDNSISEGQLTDLRAHAAHCAECAALLSAYDAARKGLKTMKDEEIEVPSTEMVWQQVSPRLVEPAWSRLLRQGRGLKIAATLLVVAGTFAVFQASSKDMAKLAAPQQEMRTSAPPVAGADAVGFSDERPMIAAAPAPAEAGGDESGDKLQMAAVSAPPFNAMAEPKRAGGAGLDYSTPQSDRHVERVATVGLRVDDARAAFKQVSNLVAACGGNIVTSHVSQPREAAPVRADLTVKVPVARYDGFLADLHGMGEILSEEINGQDRTDAVNDVEGRLADKDSVIASLRNRLVTEKLATEEINRIEAQINRLRSEREQIESARRALLNRTEYATFAITLEQGKSEPRGGMVYVQQFLDRFSDSLAAGTTLFSWGVSLIVLVLGAVLPWTVVLVPAWLVIRRKLYAW